MRKEFDGKMQTNTPEILSAGTSDEPMTASCDHLKKRWIKTI